MAISREWTGCPRLVSVELLNAILLDLKPQVDATKEPDCLLNVRVVFAINANVTQESVGGNGVPVPVVQHIELVEAGVHAACQVHVQLDHGLFRNDVPFANQAPIGRDRVRQSSNSAVPQGIVTVHWEQLCQVGCVELLVDGLQGVMRIRGWCKRGRQIVLQAQRAVVLLGWMLSESICAHLNVLSRTIRSQGYARGTTSSNEVGSATCAFVACLPQSGRGWTLIPVSRRATSATERKLWSTFFWKSVNEQIKIPPIPVGNGRPDQSGARAPR